MSHSAEREMASLKLNVLEEKRSVLCYSLIPRDHYPYLRSRYILSRDDEEIIESLPQNKQKVHKFLDILIMKGPTAYDELVKSIIKERTQIFLAEELNRAFEEKTKRLHVLMKPTVLPIPAHDSTDNDSLNIAKQKQINVEQSSEKDVSKLSSVPQSTTVSMYSGTTVSDLGVDTDKLPIPHVSRIPTTNEERESVTNSDIEVDSTCSEDGNFYSTFHSQKSGTRL